MGSSRATRVVSRLGSTSGMRGAGMALEAPELLLVSLPLAGSPVSPTLAAVTHGGQRSGALCRIPPGCPPCRCHPIPATACGCSPWQRGPALAVPGGPQAQAASGGFALRWFTGALPTPAPRGCSPRAGGLRRGAEHTLGPLSWVQLQLGHGGHWVRAKGGADGREPPRLTAWAGAWRHSPRVGKAEVPARPPPRMAGTAHGDGCGVGGGG